MAHFCKEHDTPFIKHTKDDKVWYSHKKEDGSWCNEPPEEVVKKVSPPAESLKKSEITTQGRTNEVNSSIEAQTAIKAIVELIVSDKIKTTDPLFHTAKSWMADKLAWWSSMGEVESQSDAPQSKSEPIAEQTGGNLSRVKPATLEQRKRLSAVLKKWDAKEAKELLIERWHTNETKHLNYDQMEDFIKQLEKGIIKEPEEIEPENVPF